ncbi:MAG: SRPBCC domain-containing protein [Opitutaceae bacterium]|jgi:uncharacterized protein YndB with AHSA1/START domain
MTKTIRHNVTVGADPKAVYAALIDERRHARFTGAPATISRKVGGSFTCYGGHLTGINLELVPSKRIVQAWRAKGRPAGVHSIVSFALSRKAGGRTRIAFTHLGVPASEFKDINKGWRTFYRRPLKALLEK